MANTTNFGWETPDDTDLVKDGAAAIRTLAGAIDTSLVDLKGGTTNQVLAKNSNTDMDFKWVADATGMTNPMTTTGDTIYSSSGSTPARLAIGSTGQVLTVSAGVPSWATPAAGSNWTLIDTLSGNSGSSVTINVSGYNTYRVQFGMGMANANATTGLRVNGLTAANYRYVVTNNTSNTNQTALTRWRFNPFNNWSGGDGLVEITNANSAGIPKIFGQYQLTGGVVQYLTGSYNDNITVSSISIETGDSFTDYILRVWGL